MCSASDARDRSLRRTATRVRSRDASQMASDSIVATLPWGERALDVLSLHEFTCDGQRSGANPVHRHLFTGPRRWFVEGASVFVSLS